MSASWVIRIKDSKKVLFETFNPLIPKALNTTKYEAVPIMDYLIEVNTKIKNGQYEDVNNTVAHFN